MKNIYIVISSLRVIGQCFLFLAISVQTYAAYPTVEGLFRNGNNKDLIGDFIVVKAMIEEVQNEEILRRIKVSEGDEIVAKVFTHKELAPQFIKLIYSIEGENRADLLKVRYSDSKMKKSSLKSSQFVKGVRRLIRKDEDYERGLFNSILLMLIMNESKEIVSVLHNLGITLPTNLMMMNSEKITLMDEYKKYLMAIREDASLKEELISPLKPVDEDEKTRVEELSKSNMYKRSENISLVKERNKFYWKLKHGNFEAYFRNGKHRLDRLQAEINGKLFTVNCGEYVLFNGVHELPTQILIKDTKERVYKMKLLTLSNFVNKGKKLHERARDYKGLEEEINKKIKGTRDQVQEDPETIFGLLY